MSTQKYFQACPGMHYGKEPRLISSETTEPRHQCKLAMRTKQQFYQFYICQNCISNISQNLRSRILISYQNNTNVTGTELKGKTP